MFKLNEKKARAIYLDRRTSDPEIAKFYGVSQSTVHNIRQKKTWLKVIGKLAPLHRIDHRTIRSGNRSLSDLQARLIFTSRDGEQQLARYYGVSRWTIRRIRQRRTYRNMTQGL